MSLQGDLYKVMNYSWIPFRGCLIQILPEGKFKWGKTEYNNIGEVEAAIIDAGKNISRSIYK
jgi:hypothetical protein